MSVLDNAIVFATEKHAGMFRKGTTVPYIVHPLEAVSIAAGITDDLEVLSAVVLHDVVEDTPVTVEDIRVKFGERIAMLVAAESEDKMPGITPEESWKLRKQATIDALESASFEEKIIVLADKLSNIRAIYRDKSQIGDAIWERFNQKDKKQHEWYYRSVMNELADMSKFTVYQEFCQLVKDAFG